MADERGYVTVVCDDMPRTVVLTDVGARTLDVLQAVRRLTGLSLWHSKVLMDQAPVVIHDGISEEAAEIAVAALREAGAQADVRPQLRPDSPGPAV
ncbi:ribosomal protein L7/L12 [Streptomyces fructofermentans]|uniref:ribosomal protein L7/L12 n=1 Tax=Streptomyces fructofermentans TaxID=152141 RepID=UPI0033E866B1